MHTESAARRWLPKFATGVLLGITGWQLVDSALPPRLMLVEIEVVVVAAVMLEITIRLRHASRVGPSTAALVQGLTSVGLCTLILGLSATRLSHPVPLIVLGFVAVLLTVDPSARAAALWTILLASLRRPRRGVVVEWDVRHGRRQGVDPDRRARHRRRRPRVLELVAHRPPLSGAVATAASGGRRRPPARPDDRLPRRRRRGPRRLPHAYPDASWGRVLLFDTNSGALATLPLILGPGGVTPAAGPLVTMPAGEGVIGRVYSEGDAVPAAHTA